MWERDVKWDVMPVGQARSDKDSFSVLQSTISQPASTLYFSMCLQYLKIPSVHNRQKSLIFCVAFLWFCLRLLCSYLTAFTVAEKYKM